jgi:hypothetical protein
VIIGNSLLYGFEPLEIEDFESCSQLKLKDSPAIKLTTHDIVIDDDEIASASDTEGFEHTLYYFPVFILSDNEISLNKTDTDSLITLDNEPKSILYNFINSKFIQPICLGYGKTDLLLDTLLNDFESLYFLEELINKHQISLFAPYKFSFYKEDGVTIALFKSLVSFNESYEDVKSSKSMIDNYLSFTKNFRTALAILKLLGRPFKILKAPLIRESIIDESILNNPLLKNTGLSLSKDYIIEKLDGNASELLEVDNVEVDAYEDVQSGVIGVLITWYKNNSCILRESVYPTKFDTDDFINDLKKQIKDKIPTTASLNVSKHDINNESEEQQKIIT